MREVAELYIPGKPKPKGRPRVSRVGGYAYTPGPTVQEEKRVAAAFQEAFPDFEPVVDRPLSVTLTYTPDGQLIEIRELDGDMPRWRGDLDNIVKLTLDALNGIAWKDDKQVIHLDCFKGFKGGLMPSDSRTAA